MAEPVDRYPLAVLLELRERELEEARLSLVAAHKRVSEREEAHSDAAALADRAERALSAFQIEVDNRLDDAFTAAERQWLSDEEDAVAARADAANTAFREAEKALQLSKDALDKAQAACADCARLLKAARRHHGLWIARRAAKLEAAEEMDMEARVFSLTDEPTS